MKKTIFLSAIIVSIVLLIPVAKADAIFMKATITVTSIKIPERAVMVDLPAATEFKIQGVSWSGGLGIKFQILNPSNVVVREATMSNILMGGVVSPSLVFEHTGGNYTPRIRIQGVGSSCYYCANKHNPQYANCQTAWVGAYASRVDVAPISCTDFSCNPCPSPPSQSENRNCIYVGNSSSFLDFNFTPIP